MPKKADYETFWEKKRYNEAAEIDKIIREEGVNISTVQGEATILRPNTKRALEELAKCETLCDFKHICAENRAWRIRRGETCEHEL